VTAVLLIVGPLLLPEFRDPNAGRADVVSAVMSLACVLAIIYGVKRVAQDGIGVAPVVSIAGGVVVGAAFVWRQHHLAAHRSTRACSG
jgi:DHA2 family multidrug resistance protein-like MFS transporter